MTTSYTLTRPRRPQDGRRVQLRHAGELATATWAGDRWQLVVHSTTLRDLAMHHGWTLAAAAPAAAEAAPSATQAPAPRAQAQQAPSGATAPQVAPATLAAEATQLVAGTVGEVVAALQDSRWHSDAALQAVLDAEAAGDRRKGVRRAVARLRRELGEAG
jgi:hypothetical protein